MGDVWKAASHCQIYRLREVNRVGLLGIG